MLTGAIFTTQSHNIRNIRKTGALGLFFSALASYALYISVYDPMLYIRWGGFWVLIYMLMYITFYHALFLMTRTKPSERFSKWNYIIPFLLCSLVQVLMINIPEDALLHLFQNYREPSVIKMHWQLYPEYVFLFMMKPVLFYVIDIYYAVMAIMRVVKHYKQLQLRHGETRKNKTWAVTMTVIIIASAGIFLIVSQHGAVQFDLGLLFITILVNNACDVIFIYYLMSDNFKSYMLYDCDDAVGRPRDKTRQMTVRRFEQYMSDNKPHYMDKQSRISDIYNDFNITADEFTQFIKEHYHQMPGVWLRRWRRIQEIGQLTYAEQSRAEQSRDTKNSKQALKLKLINAI
ncbi:MAG: hypothetical protein LBM20_07460 [Rikenellaceae bacterium]|jgi:hypothetical protein|nr:hypothetical protein [Rikenellaceae bacterium]